jgi:hypothetical protein
MFLARAQHSSRALFRAGAQALHGMPYGQALLNSPLDGYDSARTAACGIFSGYFGAKVSRGARHAIAVIPEDTCS